MSQSPPGGSRRPRRRFGVITLVIILLLILIILLFFFPRPRATVTLTPVSQNLSTSINLLTDNVAPFQENGTKTGTPTGQPKPGTNATGTLTFQNYTLNWVTIPQGTSISTNTGQQVVTDAAAYLPPDPPSIPGTASVPAHAANIGKDGNIPAMSFNDTSCCSSLSTGITVTNASAFSGGTDSQTMKTVQQSDIDSVVNDLVSTLTQKAQSDLPHKVKSGEKPIPPAQCSQTNVTTNPGVGESTTSFTVTVSLSCSGTEYDPQTASHQAEDKLKQIAAQRLPGFILAGTISTKINEVDKLVLASGTWKYQFTASQKSNMAKHIERETKDAAQAWLLKQKGVHDASISLTGPILLDLLGQDNTLPDDLNAIMING